MDKQFVSRIFLDEQVVHDVDFIAQNSKDLATDMSILLWVYAKRNFGGNYPDWTTLPIVWFSKQSGMGSRRIKDSVDRLVSWGILQQMHPEKRRHNVMKYRYNRRNPIFKPAFVDETKKEVETSKPVEVKKVEVPKKSIPMPAMENGKPTGKVWIWGGHDMQLVSATLQEEQEAFVCPICGKKVHRTMGIFYMTNTDGTDTRGTKDGKFICMLCGLKIKVEKGEEVRLHTRFYKGESLRNLVSAAEASTTLNEKGRQNN